MRNQEIIILENEKSRPSYAWPAHNFIIIMASITTRTTELEAVNTMLSSIGEAPVNSLASGFEDAELADKAFVELMGDDVQPRREYIEANATAVANLDI